MTKEENIQNLIDKSQKYLEASALLIEQDFQDSAVSRIYYAMFYSVQALLLEQGIVANTHKGTITKFHELFIKTGVLDKETALILSEGFDKRGVADYDATFYISKEDAESLYQKATKFCMILKNHLNKESL